MPPRPLPITLAERLIVEQLAACGPRTVDELSASLAIPRAVVRAAVAELAREGRLQGRADDRLSLVS